MRLATVREGDRHRLVLATTTGFVDVAESLPEIAEARDAGELLALGERAIGAVMGLADEPARGQPYGGPGHLAPPVLAPSKIIGVGLNYRRHAIESGYPLPDRPILFAKFASSLVGAGAPVVHHESTRQLDYEAELAVVIGRRARRVAAKDAEAHIAGYMCANDISA